MRRISISIPRLLALGALFLSVAVASMHAETPADANRDPAQSQAAAAPLTLEAAKGQARLMHQIYAATLDAMHHHYFSANKAVLPARAMEDIFADVARGTQTTARWISVNTKAMSIDHEPETPFEQQAAAALSKGATEFELVDSGVYRRAGAIPLTAGCISCHTSPLARETRIPRVAGLVIAIPVRAD